MDSPERLLAQGRTREAAQAAGALARGAPGDPRAWLVFARCLAANAEPEPALAAYDRALSLAPADAASLAGKGAVLEALSRGAEAAEVYRQAAARDPASFEAAFALARLAIDAGDWPEAERWTRRLRKGQPQAPPVRWLGARLALGRGDAAAARALLEGLAAEAGLGPEPRAEVLLMLGQALTQLGEPAAAFAAAREGKALQRRLFAPRAAGHEPVAARYARLAGRLAEAGPEPWAVPPAAPPPAADEPRALVFLTGFPRSGTTLLEQALAGHPDVVALEEAPTLAAAHAEFLGPAANLARLTRLSDAERRHWRARYWAAVRAHGVEPAGKVFVDKAPAGVDDLPLLAALFPRARVLFALRDPRDVVLSCFLNGFQMNALTYAFTDLEQTARAYAAAMALAETCRRNLPLAWRDVRHEALVDDFAGELQAICGFLDLAWTPAMLDVAATALGRAVRTPSAPQVRAGLNRKGLGRWREHAADLAPALSVLAPWVERFGYEGA